MFEDLKISEIKKVESAANKFFNRKDCKVTAYSVRRVTESNFGNWYEVNCEICFNYEEPAEYSVLLNAFMDDRRRSFATVKTW